MKKHRRLIQVIAVVLAVLLAGGVVFGALFGALAEEAPRNRHEITMEYLEDEQALHITQRLVYVNASGAKLESVVFYAAGNMFRRESALMYGPEALETVFFAGYAPAGIDLRSVRLDGEAAEFGFQGEDELYLRVACALADGATGVFEFDYYLLLMRCGAFQGAGDTDVRLSAFNFVPAVYDAGHGEFILKKPIAHARWLYCDAADYAVTLTLPDGWLAAGTGGFEREARADGRATWRSEAANVRDFALCFGKRWRVYEAQSASGVAVRVFTNVRGAGKRAAELAAHAIDRCEDWFGAFPVGEMDLAQSDYPLSALTFTGAAWLTGSVFSGGDALARAVRLAVVQQYFGLAAYPEPSADAWLSDAVSQYAAWLLLEDAEGQRRALEAVNRDWVSALQQTVPGGLRITSDAMLFDADSYRTVVLERGAVVLHELRLAMGLEGLLDGLANFYRMGQGGATLTELDFVSALDAATGDSWRDFLTDWLFNVGDYVQQDMDWYE